MHFVRPSLRTGRVELPWAAADRSLNSPATKTLMAVGRAISKRTGIGWRPVLDARLWL